MATYKAEALHQRYRRRLRPVAHYSLGWLPRWAHAGRPRAAAGQRRCCGCRRSRSRPSWPAGIDQRRPLPSFARQTFRALVRRAGPRGADGDPVVLWVDTFTDHFSPEVGTGRGRRARGRRLPGRDPAPDTCCGLTWISTGQLDGARRQLRRTLDDARPGAGAGRADRRPGAVVHRRAALGRGRAAAGRAPGGRRWPPSMRTAGRAAAARTSWTPPPLTGVTGGRPAALPPARGDGLGRRRGAAGRRRAPTSPRSAAAAGWPATSASNAATTTCRSRWPRPPCCPRSAPRPTPSCWPTGSPAGPSSSSWPAVQPAPGAAAGPGPRPADGATAGSRRSRRRPPARVLVRRFAAPPARGRAGCAAVFAPAAPR